MAQKDVLSMIVKVRYYRTVLEGVDEMDTAEYLETWDAIEDMHKAVLKAGAHGLASQISALHREMVDIKIIDADDLEYEEV